MSFKTKVILDSISKKGARLITMELTYPRFIHAEFMTHRMFSRNAASSRAIPTSKIIKMVKESPAMPIYWGKNISGMGAEEELKEPHLTMAKNHWLGARDVMIGFVQDLSINMKVHKQIVNRLLEPWKYITVICTATQWSNFYSLRRHKDAQPEIHYLADMMFKAQKKSKPQERVWHIPYIQEDEETLSIDDKCEISTARCARVSYLTHDGKRDIEKDKVLYQRLLAGGSHGHWSPFEHIARGHERKSHKSGNLVGWEQYRKMFEGECQ